MSNDVDPTRVLMVGDVRSEETCAIAEHMGLNRSDFKPDLIIVDEVGDWPSKVNEEPTLDPEMLPKQLKNLDSVDPRVLEHRRYAARREQRQALTKNQLKARRRRGDRGY